MRSVWKGSISFGLVNIPVSVYPATREEKVAFKQLRKSDQSLIRYKKVAEVDEKPVEDEDIVKGYEYEKHHWITLTDEDFAAVQIESTHAIEITDFVEQAEIPNKFYHKPYFLEALKGGEKSYALLHRALAETSQVGIAKVAIRSREYLAAVKPDGLFLMLEVMHFAHEILEPEGLKPAADLAISAKELAMAKQLIESMSGAWEPEKYTDRYQEAVREMIAAKVAKQPLVKKTKKEIPFVTDDIVAILQRSLAESAKKAPTRTGDPRKRSTGAMVKRKRAVGLS